MTFQESKNELRKSMRTKLRDWFSAPDAETKTAFAVDKLKKRLLGLPEVATARSIMIYLSLPHEFPTFPFLFDLLINNDLISSRRLSVPYCVGDDLKLFLLGETKKSSLWNKNCNNVGENKNNKELFQKNLSEWLAPGAFGILEPSETFRDRPEFQVRPDELDLILVPGLAFDRNGGRLGKGKGFYDRFFKTISPDARLVGIAFDWQIVQTVPMESHDRRVDVVLTPDCSLRGDSQRDFYNQHNMGKDKDLG